MAGEPQTAAELSRKYRTKIEGSEVFAFDEEQFVVPKPLSQCRVAIVTTAGLRTGGVSIWEAGDFGFRILPREERQLFMSQSSQNFDRTGFVADLNVVYPIDRLEELAAAGTIGSVAAQHLSFMGAQPDHTMTTLRLDTGPAAARVLREDGVDVVLLTPV